jgi:hypothetical protein
VIHYHGAPFGSNQKEAAQFYWGRHAMVSFAHPGELPIISEVVQSFVLDNGAFSEWKRGTPLDISGYIEWVTKWHRHPAFDWCLIPDVIDGDEDANDELLASWPNALCHVGVPVWHLHESIARLEVLANQYRWVALGSSGDYRTPGTHKWWRRIAEAMEAVCEQGRPICKLHGLRMLDPAIFSAMPLSSADSTNAVINHKHLVRFGMYPPPTKSARAAVIADRIESQQSAPCWVGAPQQEELLKCV